MNELYELKLALKRQHEELDEIVKHEQDAQLRTLARQQRKHAFKCLMILQNFQISQAMGDMKGGQYENKKLS